MQPAGLFVKLSCAIAMPRPWLLRERKRGFEIFDRRDWR